MTDGASGTCETISRAASSGGNVFALVFAERYERNVFTRAEPAFYVQPGRAGTAVDENLYHDKFLRLFFNI